MKQLILLIILSLSPYWISISTSSGKKIKSMKPIMISSFGEKKDEFIKVEEVATDGMQNVYITDSYQFTVKKFSPSGFKILEFGKRGKNHGDFQSFPYKIICYNDTLGIIEQGSAKIQFFSSNFTWIDQISLPGPIVDLVYDNNSRIIAHIIPFSQSKEDILSLVNKKGEILKKISVPDVRGEPAFDMLILCVKRSGGLIVVFRYVNVICIYNKDDSLVTKVRVPEMASEVPSFPSQFKELGSIPKGEMFKDVTVDSQGRIFVLSGDYSKHPNKDIYVFDDEGTYLTLFTLAEKTGILLIDSKGFLYTREMQRTKVRKYKMEYSNF